MTAVTRQFSGQCQCEEIWQCCKFCNPEAFEKSVRALEEHKENQHAEHDQSLKRLAKEIAREVYYAQQVNSNFLNISTLTEIVYDELKDKVICR